MSTEAFFSYRNRPKDRKRPGADPAQPTYLYRIYAGEDGALLWVGITNDPHRRLNVHAGDSANSSWLPDSYVVTTQEFPNRVEAEYAERVAMRDENPLHNRRRPAPVRAA